MYAKTNSGFEERDWTEQYSIAARSVRPIWLLSDGKQRHLPVSRVPVREHRRHLKSVHRYLAKHHHCGWRGQDIQSGHSDGMEVVEVLQLPGGSVIRGPHNLAIEEVERSGGDREWS
jgi:hypothetical protein